jgi:hypothetical protein
MSGDVNIILRAYFFGQSWPLLPPVTTLISLVEDRIYCPRLPEKAILPALAFFVRGGTSTPYIPDIVDTSFQFDCWGRDPIEARSVYRALYDSLQGIENQLVAVGEDTYRILSAIEEVQGQDIQDIEYPGYHRVIAFFRVKMEI